MRLVETIFSYLERYFNHEKTKRCFENLAQVCKRAQGFFISLLTKLYADFVILSHFRAFEIFSVLREKNLQDF